MAYEPGVRYVLQPERTGHEMPGMREELRAGLEQPWKASLAERARLAERSAVAVLGRLLAAR